MRSEGDSTATHGDVVSAFPKRETERYSRQLLVPEVRLPPASARRGSRTRVAEHLWADDSKRRGCPFAVN